MSYREVLELNPIQIEAILCEKSEPPGQKPLELIKAEKEYYRVIYGL